MENEIVLRTVDTMPLKFQFGRVLVAAGVAFAASELAKKAYDAGYRMLEARKAA